MPRSRRSFTRSRALRSLAALAPIVATIALANSATAEPAFGLAHALSVISGQTTTGMNPYGSLSCVATTNCVAVGPDSQSLGAAGGKPTAIEMTSSVWGTPLAVPLPVGAQTSIDFSSGLNVVRCWSVGNCAAVGHYLVSKSFGIDGTHVVFVPFAALETSGVWTSTPISMPVTKDTIGTLTALSCDTSGDCTAAGVYIAINETTGAQTYYAMTTTLASGSWTAGATRTLFNGAAADANPESMSCVTASDCVVLTTVDTTAGGLQTWATTETSGTWGTPALEPGIVGRIWAGLSISCSAVGECVIVGVSAPSLAKAQLNQGELGAFRVEHLGLWGNVGQIATPLVSPIVSGIELHDVTCQSTTLCVAVGVGTIGATSSSAIPFAVTYANGAWSAGALYAAPYKIGLTNAKTVMFGSVSCPTSNSCITLGVASPSTLQASTPIEYPIYAPINPARTNAKPNPPIGVHATVAVGSATALWLPPYNDGGLRISQFVATATSPGQPTRTCVTTALTCKLIGLKAAHTYHLTVQAKNALGFSVSSTIFSFVAH